MAGYNWNHGKSNNAVAAERDGKMVATAAAKYARGELGIAGCTAADIRKIVEPCEWHHSSKFLQPRRLLRADGHRRVCRRNPRSDCNAKAEPQAGPASRRRLSAGQFQRVWLTGQQLRREAGQRTNRCRRPRWLRTVDRATNHAGRIVGGPRSVAVSGRAGVISVL